MNWKVVTPLGLAALCIYLFVSAPPPLETSDKASAEKQIPVEEAFRILAHENDTARSLWTKEIVQTGKGIGLEFSEKWKEKDVDAGPLPALFLRLTAKDLERRPLRLHLFLGSDAPLAKANLFEGAQLTALKKIRETGEPQFFYEQELELQTAMFADKAVASACVSCHNEHPDAPRRDWALNDVMGATTWTYPDSSVSTSELLEMVGAYRAAVRAAYTAYIDKASAFTWRPQLGGGWPREGYILPTPDEFMAEYNRRASTHTLEELTRLSADKAAFTMLASARASEEDSVAQAGPGERAGSGAHD